MRYYAWFKPISANRFPCTNWECASYTHRSRKKHLAHDYLTLCISLYVYSRLQDLCVLGGDVWLEFYWLLHPNAVIYAATSERIYKLHTQGITYYMYNIHKKVHASLVFDLAGESVRGLFKGPHTQHIAQRVNTFCHDRLSNWAESTIYHNLLRLSLPEVQFSCDDALRLARGLPCNMNLPFAAMEWQTCWSSMLWLFPSWWNMMFKYVPWLNKHI